MDNFSKRRVIEILTECISQGLPSPKGLLTLRWLLLSHKWFWPYGEDSLVVTLHLLLAAQFSASIDKYICV